jgi:phosphoserine / homoserine phosphotransferase
VLRDLRASPVVTERQQTIVCLDLEGVLVPEIWIAVAERTGIDDLRRTTRDEPDYDVLMRGRLALLDEHALTLSMIQDVISTLRPLPGACAFLDALRDRTQVMVLSDTFEQFAAPLLAQLGRPTILCHRLVVDDDRIVDYRLRMADQKRHAVCALRSLNYRIVAAGDSYNDASMLDAAHAGIWFHAPANVLRDHPAHPATGTYDELLTAIDTALTNPS